MLTYSISIKNYLVEIIFWKNEGLSLYMKTEVLKYILFVILQMVLSICSFFSELTFSIKPSLYLIVYSYYSYWSYINKLKLWDRRGLWYRLVVGFIDGRCTIFLPKVQKGCGGQLFDSIWIFVRYSENQDYDRKNQQYLHLSS